MKPDFDALLDDPPRFAFVAPWTLVLLGVVVVLLLAGCATSRKSEPLLPEVRAALSETAQARSAPLPPAVANALVPPADLSLPSANRQTSEPRFGPNGVAFLAAQVFAALAKDTRYSMLVDPMLTTPVTVNLKDVTLVEALDTLREMYGFEYRVQGTRIFVQPASLATRVFQVSYLTGNRTGRSDVRVTSGSIARTGAASAPGSGTPSANATTQESSRITTQTKSDLWAELEASLRLLVGADAKNDRQVIVSPQSGVIVVRGLPRELRAVEQYLRAARLNIERQVMLEAKIIDVQLRDGSQTGVNWAAFLSGNDHAGRHPQRKRRGLCRTVDRDAGLVARACFHRRQRPVRAGVPDQQLRSDAAVPRDTGQRAGALQPAYRRAQQPEGGVESRHGRLFRHGHHHHHHRLVDRQRHVADDHGATVLLRHRARRDAANRRKRQHHPARASVGVIGGRAQQGAEPGRPGRHDHAAARFEHRFRNRHHRARTRRRDCRHRRADEGVALVRPQSTARRRRHPGGRQPVRLQRACERKKRTGHPDQADGDQLGRTAGCGARRNPGPPRCARGAAGTDVSRTRAELPAMYLEHFRLTAAPFSITPDTAFAYSSRAQQ